MHACDSEFGKSQILVRSQSSQDLCLARGAQGSAVAVGTSSVVLQKASTAVLPQCTPEMSMRALLRVGEGRGGPICINKPCPMQWNILSHKKEWVWMYAVVQTGSENLTLGKGSWR